MAGGPYSREDKMGVWISFLGGKTTKTDLEISTENSGWVWTKSTDSLQPVMDNKPRYVLT